MFNRSGSYSKQAGEVKRSLESCETGETRSSLTNKQIKYSLDLDQTLLNLLCEIDETFLSRLHTFKNKSEIYQDLQKLNQELDNQLAGKTDPERKKQEIIKELHSYNELKDATQSMIGVISSLTGQSVTELHKKFKVYDVQ